MGSKNDVKKCTIMKIDHPVEEGKSLVYGSLDGPENSVYCRGRLKGGKKVINLPIEWVELVRPGSVTVSITPVGSFQDIIIKGVSDNQVKLEARPGVPIDCHYFIIGERQDVPRLEVIQDGIIT